MHKPQRCWTSQCRRTALVIDARYDESTADDWHNVPSFAELADALHRLALKTYPESDYAKKYGDGKVLPIR